MGGPRTGWMRGLLVGARLRLFLRIALCGAIAILLGAASSGWGSVGLFARFAGISNDVVFPRGEPDPSVLVLAIDRSALDAADSPWPWPRSLLAEMVSSLDAAGADAIILDLLLVDASDEDEVLADAMRRAGNVVLSAAPLDVGDRGGSRPPQSSLMLGPTPILDDAAAAVGTSLFLPDRADGVVRSHPLVIEAPDRRLWPSVALAAWQIAEAGQEPILLRTPDGVQLGADLIPTDDRYRLRISWPQGLADGPAEPGRPPTVISMAEVLSGRLDPADVAGRTVFVGVTDPSLGDRFITPVSGAAGTPGVTYHAAAYHTLASRQFLVPASTAELLAWAIIAALFVALATQFLPLSVAAVVDAAILLGVAVAVYSRIDQGVLVNVVDPVAAAALAIPLSGALRHFSETRLRLRVSRMFSEYVPGPIAAQLVRDGNLEEAAEGQRLQVSVLFCDLRDFTPFAATTAPAGVKRTLSLYYEYVSDRVLSLGGTVVQYVGDEVFAVFGAPVPTDDHADRAIESAMTLQRERGALHAQLTDLGGQALEFGISVHSGEVVAAIAGSASHRQYVIIGDTVNVGSRLCGHARGGEVIVSEPARDRANQAKVGEAFEPELKGVARSVDAWRLLVPAETPAVGPAGVPADG